MSDETTLDTRGLRCPLPVLKLRKHLQSVAPGGIVVVEADDPVALVDIPHFCTEAGHQLLEQSVSEASQTYRIAKGSA